MSEGKVILETTRLILRHQVIEDLDDLWALYCNPEITRYIPDAPRSREEAREELEWHMNGHPRFPELGLWGPSTRKPGNLLVAAGFYPGRLTDNMKWKWHTRLHRNTGDKGWGQRQHRPY